MARRHWGALGAGVVAALGIIVAPLAGASSADQRLMISQRMQATGPATQTGTWVAAGAINDAGLATATFVTTPHGDDKGLVTATHVLTSASGTITLVSHTWARPNPAPTPPRVMVEGTWDLVAATGVYADLKARGNLYATADLTTGEITIVRDGNAE